MLKSISQKYDFEKNDPRIEKIIDFIYDFSSKKPLPPQMHLVDSKHLESFTYYIDPGAVANISHKSNPVSVITETSITIFGNNQKIRESAKSVLEEYLDFKF